VELSILTTAVLLKHIPLVWEMSVMEMSTPFTSASSSELGKVDASRPGICSERTDYRVY
jgi:hypothetical protein